MRKFVVLVFAAVMLACSPAMGQTVNSFEGIDASQLLNPALDFDPNGAIGTKQYMEWINNLYQAYDKNTFAPVWPRPVAGNHPWVLNGTPNCSNLGGDGEVMFDRLASRWIVTGHGINGTNYFWCIAVSNTDDLSSKTLAWYTYDFPLNSVLGQDSAGNPYDPDWPKLGVWSDAYYVSMDLLDPVHNYRPIGVVVCALDRTNILTGSTARTPQCFSDPSPLPVGNTVLYLSHSLIPADVEGTTAPPAGRNEFLVSIQNPPHNNKTTTSSSINLWSFHVDWNTPANSKLTKTSVTVPTYTPGCYNAASVLNTVCVPEPTHNIDSVGDRLMPRLAYRNFGAYESFLVSHTVNINPTSVRWYELRGSGTPTLHQSGTLNSADGLFRFMPSIAQDQNGNAAVGYSVSNSSTHPGIRSSWWNLTTNTAPAEVDLFNGSADEDNSTQWGDYVSMTVDPVNECTFWYVNEYFATNQTGSERNWHTRIANFNAPGCGTTAPPVTPPVTPPPPVKPPPVHFSPPERFLLRFFALVGLRVIDPFNP